jgi:hypothetical protein
MLEDIAEPVISTGKSIEGSPLGLHVAGTLTPWPSLSPYGSPQVFTPRYLLRHADRWPHDCQIRPATPPCGFAGFVTELGLSGPGTSANEALDSGGLLIGGNSHMPCKYCSAPVTSSTTCSDCDRLIAQRFWGLLAHRWLTARPEDWVPDVAAFIEVSADRAEASRIEEVVVP